MEIEECERVREVLLIKNKRCCISYGWGWVSVREGQRNEIRQTTE